MPRPFVFPDLHTEVYRLWGETISARIFSPAAVNYSTIMELRECNYGAMPRVEQTLASCLSPKSALSLKALPMKPLKTSLTLVGKAYMATGHG